MLGKTANGLFWMYRYLERADCTVRLIETGQRIALTRSGSIDDDWTSVLQSAGSLDAFLSCHDEVTKDGAIDWLLRGAENHSSVRNCIDQARFNARLVRTALTPDTWEAVNYSYIVAKELLSRKVNERDLPKTIDRIRNCAALVRGATSSTMLRNDIYNFLQLGTHIERADNTARILDVKYYVLLPSVSAVGSSIDNIQWETILRSVSAHGGFRMQYGSSMAPRDIARFLILDPRMPRSLTFCALKIRQNLRYLQRGHGPQPGYDSENASLAMADHLLEHQLHQDIDSIFEYGLHEFIQTTISAFADLAQQIEIDYRFYQ